MSTLAAAVRSLRTARGLLWAAVVLTAAALIGAVVYGEVRDRQKNARVEAVSLYVRQVNGVERGLAPELAKVRETYRSFGNDPRGLEATIGDLEAAVTTIEGVRERLVALSPPPEAERLHAEILKLIGLELALSRELRDLGKTLPLIAEGSERTQRASRQLLRDLRTAESLAAQAAAFHGYSAALSRVAARFEQLNAPAVLKPSLATESKRLRQLSALAKRTGNALAAEQVEDAQRLSNHLAKAAASGTVVTKAERSAVRAYQQRVRAVGDQERVVAVERERIAAELA